MWVKNQNIDVITFIDDLIDKYMLFFINLNIIENCIVVASSIHLPNCNNDDQYLKKIHKKNNFTTKCHWLTRKYYK